MVGTVMLWYIVVTLLGWLAFPLAYRLLPNLADRGYTFSRALGLLLGGFLFWMLASLRLAPADGGGVWLALGLTALLSGWALRRTGWRSVWEWVRGQKTLILSAEGLFLGAFVLWVLMRAGNPEILGTEKPMEMAFINAILRSPSFPPHDPWLSGYAISYYYFGYVIIALLTRLTGADPAAAFNLGAAMWFALTALGAYGVLYNLLARRGTLRKAAAWAALAPLFLLVVTNFQGSLDMLHARGAFWSPGPDGTLQSPFWQWVGIQEVDQPPTEPLSWNPTRRPGIWWWRASRVLQDFDAAGNSVEVIDEFPFFSYYLGDLHPHVLAMPFVLLAVGLALNLFQRPPRTEGQTGVVRWLGGWLSGKDDASFSQTHLTGWLRSADFWLAALVMGGLSFLNTWDFPIYVGLFCLVYAFTRYEALGWGWGRVWEFLELGAALGIAGVILYLPFYVGFSSQAGGILPSVSFFTRGVNFWVMFGTLLIPIAAWLFWQWSQRTATNFRAGLRLAAGVIFGLWAFSYLLAGVILAVAALTGARLGQGGLNDSLYSLSSLFFQLQGSADARDLLLGTLARRLLSPGAWLTLLGLLAAVWGLLPALRKTDAPLEQGKAQREDGFVLLLLLTGLALTTVPEFVYLRDQFGWRMNTIFKFYFQAWLVWSLAAAYASVTLWQALTGAKRWVFGVLWALVVVLSLAYPFWAVNERMGGLSQGRALSLDGTRFLQNNPDELDAIRFLQQAPLGTVAEAVGGQYTSYARMATFSGQPNVLGWPGHEAQWRGGGEEMGSRQPDIELLYRTSRWEEAASILERYQIRYVVVGSLELGTYPVNEVKFQKRLKLVFERESVRIYEVPQNTGTSLGQP